MAPGPVLLPFLRPLSLPRSSTVRHFLQFSTTSTCRAFNAPNAPKKVDRNLVASRNASPSYPPPSMKSLPRPKVSRASRRVSHPPKEREYPTRQRSHQKPEIRKLIPEPVEFLDDSQCAPNLPYFVSRTPNSELPIYTLRKRGGNLKLTRVKKIDGKREVLRDELKALLGITDKEAVINGVTGHIMLKGHYRSEVEKFLRQRKF